MRSLVYIAETAQTSAYYWRDKHSILKDGLWDIKKALTEKKNPDQILSIVLPLLAPDPEWVDTKVWIAEQWEKIMRARHGTCNSCGRVLAISKDRECVACDAPIETPEPKQAPWHPFPHNHESLRMCHQDSA